jgi:hypothetical protein
MFRTMLPERIRRLLAWPLALTRAVGLVVHPVYAIDTSEQLLSSPRLGELADF